MKVPIYLAPTVTELLAHLAALPRGEKNVIFCEDRLTLEAERAVARAQGAAFDTTVTTFARFLRGTHDKKTISKQGSVMVVGNALLEERENLLLFGRNPAGSAARLYETIAQLRAACVTPDMLDAAREQAEGVLAGKLADIALIYRRYLAFLDRGFLDESGQLALLPEAIAGGSLSGANVIFAGFTSFTRQAAEGIRAALSAAKKVEGVFLGGDAELYTDEAASDFERYCRMAGAKCERIPLPSTLCREAETLRRGIFDPVLPAEPVKTDKVHIFEGADKEDELSFIAAMIKSEVLDRGTRYGEIALFLSDVADYSVALQKTFAEYNIPYFSDEKRSAAAHPLAAFVSRWFSLLSEGFDPADADAFVGNVFFGGDRVSRERYRNYLAKYANYRGGALRPIKEAALQPSDRSAEKGMQDPLVLLAVRERFLTAFEGASAAMTGGQYCRLVRALVGTFDCEKTQTRLSEAFREKGMLAESGYFSRGLESLFRVLDEAEPLLENTRLRAEEFSAILTQGLSSLEISLIPQYLDAVYVGDISESKKSAAKAVFAGRLTDAVPMCGADTALISDRDIDRLRTLEVEIRPKIREVNARARENAGLALCGFTGRLYLSYPLSLGGDECKRSEVVGGAAALFCTPAGKPLPVLTRRKLEESERSAASSYLRYLGCAASERVPAVREILTRADAYRRGKGDFSVHAAVYEVLREAGDAPAGLLFDPPKRTAFISNAAEVAFRGKNTVSPTFIEGYFACPYRNFAERGLKLAEHEEMLVQPVDTGNFVHDLLCLLAGKVAELADEAACEAFLREQGQKLLSAPPYCFLSDTAAGGYTAEALLEEAVIVGKNVFEQLKNSQFSVVAAEETFGYPDSKFKGIRLTSGRRRLFLAGKIDRVDRCGEYTRVVDYKTGRFEAKAESYYTGRKLQLELYLSAAKGEGRAAGAYYFPARVAFRTDAEEPPFRMQGFTVGDDAVVRMNDSTVEPGKKSRYIDAYYGKKSKKSMSGEQFEDFIAYSVLAARKGAEETERGCIAASPYKGACDYCPYGGLCGYDLSDGARQEKKITEEEIARIAGEKRGEL